jgi:threonine dehydrogenase-like Zn-dependent dehydrogenase
VGLSATQLAVEMGARVIAVDIAPERRQLARQFGAAEVIDPTAHDMVAAIAELTRGEGAHKTLDASSAPDARAAAVRSVRAWGTACFVGERGQVTLDVSADLLRRQVTLVGSWTFSKQARPSAPSSSPTGRWTWSGSSRTAGGSSRPRKPTGCSTRRRPARPSSCRPDVSERSPDEP